MPSGLAAASVSVALTAAETSNAETPDAAVCAGASLEASANMKKPVTADAPRLPRSWINFALLPYAAGSAVRRLDRVALQGVRPSCPEPASQSRLWLTRS